jgi:hypothetical protein
MNKTEKNNGANRNKKKRKKDKVTKKNRKRKETNANQDFVNVLSVPLAPQIVAAASTNNVNFTKPCGSSNISWSWKSVFNAAANVPQEVLDEEFINRTSEEYGQGGENVSSVSQLAKEFNVSTTEIPKKVKVDDKAFKIISKPTTSVAVRDSHVMEAKQSKKRKKSDDDKKKKKKQKKKQKPESKEPGTLDSCTVLLSQESSKTYNHPKGTNLEGKMIDLPFSSRGPGEKMMVLINRDEGLVYSAFDQNDDGNKIIVGKIKSDKDDEEIQFDPHFLALKESCPETNDANIESSFPYPADADDHCESPANAYKDIIPLLEKIVESNCIPKEKLAIYDPYYCNGSVIKNFASLGFPNVYNKKEDCYLKWASNASPHHDVFITNPPYSEDHIPKLFNHLTNDKNMTGKPWFLLMPSWVHKKDYYIQAMKKTKNGPIQPFYVVPKKRYVYSPPKKFREKKKSDVHKKSSPFVSMWYIWGGDNYRNELLIKTFLKYLSQNQKATCELARSKSGIRDLRRKSGRNK